MAMSGPDGEQNRIEFVHLTDCMLQIPSSRPMAATHLEQIRTEVIQLFAVADFIAPFFALVCAFEKSSDNAMQGFSFQILFSSWSRSGL